MKNWKLGTHIGLMLILSVLASFSIAILFGIDLSDSYHQGRAVGRAFGAALLPLLLFGIWRGIYKLFAKAPQPSNYIGLWASWFGLFIAATIGSVL